MSKYNHNVDGEISLTYIFSNKKLTIVAALGVTIGIAIFIFMNCLTNGFSRRSDALVFESYPHIHIYKDDAMSEPIAKYQDSNHLAMIVNPKIVPQSDRIINPEKVIDLIRKQPNVTLVTPLVNVNVFYNSGKSKFAGISSGVRIEDADQMFSIQSTMVEGNLKDLKTTANGILLGVGIAQKMNAKTGDNISITSSNNVTKVMKVVGLFQTHYSATDKTKSYVNISAAQQLLSESPSYISDIDVNIMDYNKAPQYAQKFSYLTGYKAEDWQTANATLVSASKMRDIMVKVITMSILLVAGFGIYNILNMTVNQKINEIAILKAMGFQGKDVIRIFVVQSMIIGVMGVLVGMIVAYFLISMMAKVYIGADIGYFPITHDVKIFTQGAVFGIVTTLVAGYMPAKRAANLDPVDIFRK